MERGYENGSAAAGGGGVFAVAGGCAGSARGAQGAAGSAGRPREDRAGSNAAEEKKVRGKRAWSLKGVVRPTLLLKLLGARSPNETRRALLGQI